MEKRNKYSWAFAFVIAFLQAGFIITHFSGWGYDDAFITYRYAENLARGLGFVYNPGEQILSTTSPLFTIILSIFYYVSSEIPHTAVWIGTICLSIGGLFLWDLHYSWKKPLAAWLTLVIYPIFPLLLNTLGSETPLFLVFCLGAMDLYARSQYSISAAFLAFATLARPEGILVAILILAHFFTTQRKTPPWKVFLVYALIGLPWILFAFIYFGSPIPATLAAKQAQGAMSISQRFAPGLLSLITRNYVSRWQYWLMTLLSIVGILSGFSARDRNFWLLPTWSIIHFLGISLLGVTSYFWYYAPIIPGFIALSGLGMEALIMHLQKWITLNLRFWKMAGFSAILILGFSIGNHARQRSQFPDQRLKIYQGVGEWIYTHTEDHVQVGALEVGIIGYCSQRMMIDFAGIIQPAVADVMTPSTTFQDTMKWAIMTYRPEILVLTKDQVPGTVEEILNSRCEHAAHFEGIDYDYPHDLLAVRCRW